MSERKQRRVQQGWKAISISVRLSEHDRLTAQAAALGITPHRMVLECVSLGLPILVQQSEATTADRQRALR